MERFGPAAGLTMANDGSLIERCKRQAKRIKSDYPEIGYMQRLDVVAKQMGFLGYVELSNAGRK